MKNLAAILLLSLLASCDKHEKDLGDARNLPTAEVTAIAAISAPYIANEEVVGTVRSKLRSVVEAKVSGRILEYLATPGTLVKSGDLLARLDVQEIQAKVDQAKAMLDQAQRDFERQKTLVDSKATSRQEYDAANAHLKMTEAGLSEAETMMSYAIVTAPFDGVITRKLADVGDLAMPGKPLLEIEAPTVLRFEANLPEGLLEHIQMGAKMNVTISSVSIPLDAIVSEISPVADPASRTFMVKLDLPAAVGLRSGQFGRVAVPVAETKLLLVPESAVIRRGQMELMFVAKDGKALLRLVKTGKRLDDKVEVLSGIEEGEEIIVSEVAGLTDGQAIQLKP